MVALDDLMKCVCKYSERFYKQETFHLAKAEIFFYYYLNNEYTI